MNVVKRLSAVLTLAWGLAGCATSGGNPADPLEPFNRAMFSFNDTVDNAVMKPVAKGYRAVLPGFVRTGITNFFSNLEDVWITVNDLLQGKFLQGGGDFTRFLFNSTIGLLGVIDFASDIGLEKHNEDFGQTLGRWGLGNGAYLVLPFLGPSTVRDGFGLLLDFKGDLVVRINDVPTRNSLYATRLVSKRSDLLDATNLLDQAALDRYSFVRDAWLQRRLDLVYDGDPPREHSKDDEDPR